MEPLSPPLDGGRLPSILVYLACLSVLAHVFGSHCNMETVWLIATGKRALVWPQLCSNAVFFLSWILVFFSGTLSSHGFGEPESPAICSVQTISMLCFYCTIKIFLHCFLVDRAYTVWTAGSTDVPRLRSRLWWGGMLATLVYPGLLVLNIIGRASSVDDRGQCLISFSHYSTGPTLAWSGILTVSFALIFAYPLRRTAPTQTSNPMIRTISSRALIASLVAFLAGTVNTTLFIGLGQQPAWIYGISTVLDLTITSFALHRIASDTAHLAAAEVRRGSLSHALGLPLRDVGLGGEVFLPSLPLASPGLMSHGSEYDHDPYYPCNNVPRSPTKATATKDKQKAVEGSDKFCTGVGKMEVGVAQVLPMTAVVTRRDGEMNRRSWKEWIFPAPYSAGTAAAWPPIPLPVSVLQATASTSFSGSTSKPVTDEVDADLEGGQREMIAPWENQALPPWHKRLRKSSLISSSSTKSTVKASLTPSPRTAGSERKSMTAPPSPSHTQTAVPARLRSNSSSSSVDALGVPRKWSCSPIVFSRSRRSRVGTGDDADSEIDLDLDFASLTPSLEEEFGPRGRSMSFGGESGRKMSVCLSEGGQDVREGGEKGWDVDGEGRNGSDNERIPSPHQPNDWSNRTFSKVDVVPPP